MSVLARVFESAGLATVAVALLREHAARVKPPRALWVPFYFGYALGKPDDPAFQHRVIAAALDLLQADSGPVLADYPDEAGPVGMPQASEVAAAIAQPGPGPGSGIEDNNGVSGNGSGSGGEGVPGAERLNAADTLTALRPYYERWLEQRGRTAVGITGVPQRRFRGVVRFFGSLRGKRRRRYGRPAGGCVRAAVRPLLRRRPEGVLLRGADDAAS